MLPSCSQSRLSLLRIFFAWAGTICVGMGAAYGQSPIGLNITNSPGYAIPADFIGLSFGTQTAGQIFTPTNTQLINLFQQIGIKNLRVMGDEQNNHTKNLLNFAK